MKTLVLYTSLTGFTRRYAEWIAEALGEEAKPLDEADEEALANAEVVIFGGSLHASGITGLAKLKERLPNPEAKHLAVFAVGATPTGDKLREDLLSENFSASERERIDFFYLRGGFDFRKLDFRHKIIMTLFKWKLSMQRDKSPDVVGMLEAYKNPVDFTRRDTIRGLVDRVEDIRSR